MEGFSMEPTGRKPWRSNVCFVVLNVGAGLGKTPSSGMRFCSMSTRVSARGAHLILLVQGEVGRGAGHIGPLLSQQTAITDTQKKVDSHHK